ncbi:MAG TPA: serine/threonine-protein kinase [Gemmataceae bacterium]|nr:serine/threonine-protein kinase [Gemmataceae bacterium]
MEFTVENVCGLLIRSKLLTPDEVKAMYQRWQSEAKDAVANLPQFVRWLVSRQYVTEYQAALVAKGHADSFFINQYKILERLGRGRMAGVYKAVHHLGQVVAIKVLPPSKGKDPQQLARFQREVRLALKLKHPNVVRSFQIGHLGDLHYLVMEYLEGETLDVVLQRRRKLPPNEAVRLTYQALQGLQHLHEQGLVHRDLKPANLMLVSAAGADTTARATLKILDLGLGRALPEDTASAAQHLHLTGEGMILGTPDYLSPEQARDPRTVDVRSDIYSLGCVLYHCLTGQPPFPDTNILTQMVRHATEPPRPLKELSPEVPDGLQQIVSRMLAKDPAQRYATPEQAAKALQAFQAAGAEPARLAEDGPQLRTFLTWVETDSNSQGREGASETDAAPKTPLPGKPGSARPAKLVLSPQPAALPVPAKKQHASKKHKRHKHQAAAPTPLAATPPAPSAPVHPSEFDVDLVPTVAPPAVPVPAKGGFRLSNRDWILLGVGAASVILAGVVGIVLANVLR